MHSLYLRIFLAFWLAIALILVGTVSVAVDSAYKPTNERPWLQRADVFAQAAQAFEAGGLQRLKGYIAEISPAELRDRTFVVDSAGHDLLNRGLPPLPYPPGAHEASHASGTPPAPVGGSLLLIGPDGKAYRVFVIITGAPHRFGALELPGVPAATVIIALVVSALVCFFLARWLTAPVDRLRDATRRMAAGNLNVRVAPSLRGRQDELGLLATDFDSMAARVRGLVDSKQQLLRDVSHELRSPLARLQLALSLARRRDAATTHDFDRIAREADRLEHLIARALELARLERPASELERTDLDVCGLLRDIVADVAIEADAQGCAVALEAEGVVVVSGDADALRSAFENVLRNAVRYSQPDTRVLVRAHRSDASVEIVIEDRGPGVPEKDLALIFEPFYRVDAARAPGRARGGEGLGLAIAARAVALHGGSINARNIDGGGLQVRLALPA